MKTKDDCLLEAQNHFGVNVFSNDDGITRRIEHYAMDLWVEYLTGKVSPNQINKHLTDYIEILKAQIIELENTNKNLLDIIE